ncbi:hypothetical protein [Candidatus Leptofilum sp.]|uniref:hypothetical protein n=1 Tax=Candidatus Leptofilum sp. TaxID=3241576 RepID=UPI003B5CE348
MNHTSSSQAGFGRFGRRAVTALGLLLLALFFTAGTVSSHPHPIPTISISSVQRGDSVTFQTHNYPAGQTFTVRMGKMGTRGVGGTVVGTLESGAGGSMTASFDIPEGLKDDHQIAIRLDSNLGYYSFNWFYNNTAPPSGGTGGGSGTGTVYTGIPTFKITAVAKGDNVTIETNNFPANQTFTVTMGKMFTRGIGGIVVGTIESGEGGKLTATFEIPEALKDDGRIAIRAQTAHVNPFYAYNWFWNNSTNSGDSSEGNSGDGDNNNTVAKTVYNGIPTFTVCKVTRDGEVEILTKNYPTNQNFTVTMGPMYTRGIGGTVVGTLESADQSSARYTFSIPDHLKGSYRISMRAQTAHAHPFYSYNWFYNNSTTMDHCQ